MSINIDALAGLAHVDLAPERRERIQEDVLSILAYVETLQRLDVPDVADARGALSVDELREDVVWGCTEQEREGVVNSFSRVSDDGLLEAHAAIHRV